MKKCILSLLTLLGSVAVFAQNIKTPKCGYDLVIEKYQKTFSEFKEWQNEQYAESQSAAHKSTGTVYRIPVVFQVVYNTADANLPDSVLINQISVLNNAYRKTHADVSKTRNIFKPISADAEIEFYLATKDPNGNPTTGIVRTQTNRTEFADIASIFDNSFLDSLEQIKNSSMGGADPWPLDKYLNIWTADMSISGVGIFLYGYATPPTNPLPINWPVGSFPPLTDGVVLQYQTVGDNNTLANQLPTIGSKGRTAVHEVGHYLGLRHIWGDEDDCSGTDGINDTPPQKASDQISNLSCNDVTRNTCGFGITDTVDNWENYMDYSNELCQNMFTQGQVTHMRSILANQRKVLDVPKVATEAQRFTIYPNPANASIYFDMPGKLNAATVINVAGQVVKKLSATELNNRTTQVEYLAEGQYILSVDTEAGKAFQRFTVNR